MKRQNAAVIKNTMYLKETSWESEYISSGAPVSLPRPWATSVATCTTPKPPSHSSNYIKCTFIKYTRLFFNVFLPLTVLEWLSICSTLLLHIAHVLHSPGFLCKLLQGVCSFSFTPNNILLNLSSGDVHCYVITHLPFLLKCKLLEGSFFQYAWHLNTKMSVYFYMYSYIYVWMFVHQQIYEIKMLQNCWDLVIVNTYILGTCCLPGIVASILWIITQVILP